MRETSAASLLRRPSMLFARRPGGSALVSSGDGLLGHPTLISLDGPRRVGLTTEEVLQLGAPSAVSHWWVGSTPRFGANKHLRA
jgi:hypothetical protein